MKADKKCDECGKIITDDMDYVVTEFVQATEINSLKLSHKNTMCSEDCWIEHVRKTLKYIGKEL